jgi:hypothetical protein
VPVAAGVLVEGVIHAIIEGIAVERQAECGVVAVQLMANRLRAMSVI